MVRADETASSWGSWYCTKAKAEIESFRTSYLAIASALTDVMGVRRGRKAIALDYLRNDATPLTYYANRKISHRTAYLTVTKSLHHLHGYF